ncbi:MAG: hypothetical protein ACRYGM_02345 [Janthinobacterium lividum]
MPDDTIFHPEFRTAPYWWDAAPPEDARDAPLPASVDLLVVGSGFAGLSAALAADQAATLARRHRIHQAERNRLEGVRVLRADH